MKQSIFQAICRCSTTQLLSSADRFCPRGSSQSQPFSLSYVRRQETFVNLCQINVLKDKRLTFKTITQVQFSTKYCNRQKDQPLSKHHRVNLDVDGLKQPRYPRMKKRAIKRVVALFSLVLSKTRDVCKFCSFSNNY